MKQKPLRVLRTTEISNFGTRIYPYQEISLTGEYIMSMVS